MIDEATAAASTLFEEAARLIGRGLAKLNMASGNCQTCGHRRFADAIEARTAERLRDVPSRLRSEATWLTTRGRTRTRRDGAKGVKR